VSAQHLLEIKGDLIRFPVPVVGMLSGNSISAIVVSIDYVLKEFVCVTGVIAPTTLDTGD